MAKQKQQNGLSQALKPILAAPLVALAQVGDHVEKAATRLLDTIRRAGIDTIEAFDEHAAAAYAANGWSTKAGRPKKDQRIVPHTVRTYMWEIRSAFRAGVDVGKCKTMYELRMARKEATPERIRGAAGDEMSAEELPTEVQQDLAGVRVLAPNQPNGALWHDAIALFIRMPAERRPLYGRQIARVVHRFTSLAPVATPTEKAA